jgi:ribose transport system substrate-binding protein
MKTLPKATLLVAGVALASGAWAAGGKPLAKECGPNNDYVIGFSQANFKEPYREHVNHELERLVKNYPKFKLVIADGQASVNTQVSQVENFMTQRVDLLMISPFEAAPLTPAVSAVYKAGVPVIELDRKTTGENYTAFVGGDNRAIAKEAGEWAAKTLLPDGGEAAVLEGLPSSSPAIERLEGFKAAIRRSSSSRCSRSTGWRTRPSRCSPRCCRRIPTSSSCIRVTILRRRARTSRPSRRAEWDR